MSKSSFATAVAAVSLVAATAASAAPVVCQTNTDLAGHWVILYGETQPCDVDIAANGQITMRSCADIESVDAKGNPVRTPLAISGALFLARNCDLSGKLTITLGRGGQQTTTATPVSGWMLLDKLSWKAIGTPNHSPYYGSNTFEGIRRR